MRINLLALGVGLAGLGLAPLAQATPVAISLTGTYYTVTASGHGDFQTECCSLDHGMVTSFLTGGRPTYSGVSTFALKDVGASHQIQWWTPGVGAGGDTVVASGTGAVTTPFASTSMYPPTGPNGNVGNDASGFLTAMFTGSFNLATTSSVTFTLGADDDAFFYVDGTLVTGLGGVHGDSPAPTSAVTLGAGSHTIDLFYADRQRTQAALNFGLDSTGIVPAPEPAPIALLSVGLVALGLVRRRR